MRGFSVPPGLSALVITRKVEQRFGLLGFARLIKLVELVADAATVPAPAAAIVAWPDLLEALGADHGTAGEFLAYCSAAGVLERTTSDDRERLTLCGELAALLADRPIQADPASPVLFTEEQQWSDWFLAEFNCPPYLASEPDSRQLFRRWIATNVTTEEAEAALQLAIEAREAPTPSVLHDHLRAVRAAKIERARA